MPRCDIVPFDDYCPVELLRLDRPAHQQSRFVFVIAVDRLSCSAFRCLVAVRASGVEILLLDVTARLEVFERGEERVVVGRIARRRLRRNGTIQYGVRTKHRYDRKRGNAKSRKQIQATGRHGSLLWTYRCTNRASLSIFRTWLARSSGRELTSSYALLNSAENLLRDLVTLPACESRKLASFKDRYQSATSRRRRAHGLGSDA